MSKPTPSLYKIKTWSVYNETLKRHGSLTILLDPEMIWAAALMSPRPFR